MKGKLFKMVEGYILSVTDDGIDDPYGITNPKLAEDYGWKLLSISNCDEIFGVVDVDKLAMGYELYEKINFVGQTRAYIAGFNKAMELNKDKVFTLEDMNNAMDWMITQYFEFNEQPTTGRRDEYLKSLQQPTEMDVEIVYERDCYSSAGRCDKSTMSQCIICTPVYPLEDENGCLILKRAK
jgi:hypothetical protein